MRCTYKITTFFLADMQMEYIWAYLTGKWVENNAILCYYPVYRGIRIAWSFIEILCVNIINSNSLFTHCLRRQRKKHLRFLVSAWFWKWTSLGLNQGPPDYETLILTLYKADCQHINYLYVSSEVNNRSTLNLLCKVSNNSSYQELNHCFLLYPNAEFFIYVYLLCYI